jgi:UDP-glucose 4-epimerase
MLNRTTGMKDKNVVITGGAGFIGANLAQELAAHNRLVIIDDLSSGKRQNVAALSGGNVEFVEGSIGDLPLLKRLFKNVDFVFHQAAISSVPRSVENPLETNEVNVTGTLNVLLAARDSGVRKVVYASSTAVYGDTPALPQREDIMPNPQSPYAVAKLVGEYYCRVFHTVYGLPTVSLRYFNVYGPKQDPGSEYSAVIPRFIKRLSEGKHLVVYGDGEQTRDFVFVADVVEANILAAESDAAGVFNVGWGRSVTVNGLAELTGRIMNKDVGIVYEKARAGDIRESLADISKARVFGYQPQYDLEHGLRETISKLA